MSAETHRKAMAMKDALDWRAFCDDAAQAVVREVATNAQTLYFIRCMEDKDRNPIDVLSGYVQAMTPIVASVIAAITPPVPPSPAESHSSKSPSDSGPASTPG